MKVIFFKKNVSLVRNDGDLSLSIYMYTLCIYCLLRILKFKKNAMYTVVGILIVIKLRILITVYECVCVYIYI